MVPVVAVIKAKAGKEKELEKVLQGLVAPTRQETGCMTYVLHRDVAEPGTFVFIESWASEKELQVHLGTPHIAAAMSRKEELIESVDIRSLKNLTH